MGKIGELNSPEFVEAVQIWTGRDRDAWPGRHDDRLENRFGQVTATKLLPILQSLKADFYSSDARFTAADLSEMAAVASAHFEKKHPGIADEIVKAFAWCYTYSYK